MRPLRMVVPDDRTPWWEAVGVGKRERLLELDCGHWVMRCSLERPKRVRCEVCPEHPEPK